MRGFSFIEILISIAILGVILILFHAVLSGSFLSAYAKDKDLALNVALTELESLRQGGYANLPSSGSFSSSALDSLPQGSGTVTVTDYNDSTNATKEVVVQVSWFEHADAATHTVSLDTLITKVGGLP